MNYSHLRFGTWRLVMAVLFALGVQSLANDAPLVSGSYQVLQTRNLGSESQIQMRIYLVNHGSSDFSIQRMTLWDLSHADKGGTNSCTVALRAHASAETTQQFTIRRSDYDSWQKGFRPRLVLQLAGPGRAMNRTVVRLDRISGWEAK
jgi:hypothetical protein